MIDKVGMRVAVMNFQDTIFWLERVSRMTDDEVQFLYSTALNAPSEYDHGISDPQ